MDLSKILLITDVDGTLLDDDHSVSPKNLQAIEEVRQSGGLFTIATGRGVTMSLPIVRNLGITGAAVIFNGAAVYDFGGNRFLWQCETSPESTGYLSEILTAFPSAAAEILTDDKVYVIQLNELERQHMLLGDVHGEEIALTDAPKSGWIKSLIVDTPEHIDRIIAFAENMRFNTVNWVRSAPVYYEMLPMGVSKGAALSHLARVTGAANNDKKRFIVSAGDYYNDIDMIRLADFGAAVGNALPEVQAAADFITVDNNSDAIWHIIEKVKLL
jgi:Cof subfamily protein (haloacid dehalogenase superfamily)